MREAALGATVRNQLVYDTLQSQYTAMAREYAYTILANDTSIINMGDTSDYVYLAFYNSMQSSDAAHYLNAITAMNENNLNLAQTELNLIADTNTINHNRIIVNNIYLNSWAQSNYVLTDDQVRTLTNIAYLDPNANGDAVYTARVMLNINPDDADVKSALVPKVHPPQIKENTVKVYPNPAKKQFTIEFNDVINSNALIELYGNLGNLVQTVIMQSGTYIQNINVSQLNAGLYFYRITMNGANVSSGKLIILNK